MELSYKLVMLPCLGTKLEVAAYIHLKMFRNRKSDTDKTPLKELILQGSSRVHRCLALQTDDALEEKARRNDIYRCCIHSWSWKEDTLLWETHTDLMGYPAYVDGASLNEEGWKYVQREVSQHAAHLAPIRTLKARSAEIKRREDGSVVEFVENPTSDIANCILYRKWDTKADAFLLKTYDNLSFIPGRRRKEFLDAADWHSVQLWFTQKFGCCPSQTQLQARTRTALLKH
ncbi:hypothetical protein M5K25_017375 [Dendrobium thyrsiflorum]|uniref:Uncharacterized protein n=1 Tax=Dendrobium thyrsiflorum TaxID=117978 RepID=A0ABD0UMT5_DENTH